MSHSQSLEPKGSGKSERGQINQGAEENSEARKQGLRLKLLEAHLHWLQLQPTEPGLELVPEPEPQFDPGPGYHNPASLSRWRQSLREPEKRKHKISL